MANIASQKRRNRRTERERLENLHYRSAVKTHFRRLELALAEGDRDKVTDEHRMLLSRIDKAAKTGALHKSNAARKKVQAARMLRTQ